MSRFVYLVISHNLSKDRLDYTAVIKKKKNFSGIKLQFISCSHHTSMVDQLGMLTPRSKLMEHPLSGTLPANVREENENAKFSQLLSGSDTHGL